MDRLTDWLRRQTAEAWVTAALVAGSMLFIFVQLKPGLVFLNTTPAGGDMGAHVWGPAYLRDELLPRWRLSGWAPDWYDGFPAYQFYMVVPSLLIVVLDVLLFLPYNVAFKLVAVSGLVLLPLAAYWFGRLSRLPFPMPAALAVATVPFVFDRSFSIYGGNAASTLAGEFAFTLSLVCAIVFLGFVRRGLESGRSRALAAVFFGLTVMCHLIPPVFAIVGAGAALLLALEWTEATAVLVMVAAVAALVLGAASALVGVPAAAVLLVAVLVVAFVFDRRMPDVRRELVDNLSDDGRRVWWLASSMAVGALLSAFWVVPFYLRSAYLNDMGWEKLTSYFEMLFPGRVGEALTRGAGNLNNGDLTFVITLALVGVVTSFLFRRRFGIWLTTTAAILAVLVLFVPQSRLWNARLLPFWYLCLYFLAAVAVVEVITAIAALAQRARVVQMAGIGVCALITLAFVSFPLRSLPLGHESADGSTYSWLGISSRDSSYIPSWTSWNFTGYERKPDYPEFKRVVDTMARIGKQRGCGRANWEYDPDLDRFGTPMSLMLLPYFTDHCIDSMEGLYFEASATTPYHFLNQSELSANPSRAQRDLPYGSLDVPLGIDHLRLLGVKYYMAFSAQAVAEAAQDADLRELTVIPKQGTDRAVEWHIYEIKDVLQVQPLGNEPAVVDDIEPGHAGWQRMAVDWYLDRASWGVMRAADGPKAWQRIHRGDVPVERPYTPTKVSDVQLDEDSIRFKVDRTGSPILVRSSYFPNWKAKNAEGPYRVAPNLMVVVPTDNVVSITYGRTGVDWLSYLLTLLGIGLAVLLGRRRLRIRPRLPRDQRTEEPPPPTTGWIEDELATVGGSRDDERWAPPPG